MHHPTDSRPDDAPDMPQMRRSANGTLGLLLCAMIVLMAALTPASEYYDRAPVVLRNNASPVAHRPIPMQAAARTQPPNAPETTASPRPVSNTMNYVDADTEIHIERVQEGDYVYFAADVKLSDASQLRAGFAQGKYGKNYRAYTSKTAEDVGALLAVNGDYCGFRNDGIIIRNGILYRDKAQEKIQLLVIDKEGDLRIENERDVDADALIGAGVIHTYSFGPGLVIDGQPALPEKYWLSLSAHEPRTAIGQLGPLHYLIVTVDGRRSGYSDGVTLAELAQIFIDRGCKVAYNLDGGGSATMVMDGRVVNRVSGGGERSVSDIIYIAAPDLSQGGNRYD